MNHTWNCKLYRILWPAPCDTYISDIVTIFPIPKANFSTVALLPCDYSLVYLLDIVTILPSSWGNHSIRKTVLISFLQKWWQTSWLYGFGKEGLEGIEQKTEERRRGIIEIEVHMLCNIGWSHLTEIITCINSDGIDGGNRGGDRHSGVEKHSHFLCKF